MPWIGLSGKDNVICKLVTGVLDAPIHISLLLALPSKAGVSLFYIHQGSLPDMQAVPKPNPLLQSAALRSNALTPFT